MVLYEMIKDYNKRDIFVCFVDMNSALLKLFNSAGLTKLGRKRVFQSYGTIVLLMLVQTMQLTTLLRTI